MSSYHYFKRRQSSTCAWAVALFRFVDHTHTHTYTLGMTSLNEGSAQQTQTTNICVPSGTQARDPSKRGTVDRLLRPHGHLDLLFPYYTHQNRKYTQPFLV